MQNLNSLSLLYSKNNRETRSVSDRTTLLTDYAENQISNSGENNSSQYSLENSFRIKLDKNTNFYLSNSFPLPITEQILVRAHLLPSEMVHC